MRSLVHSCVFLFAGLFSLLAVGPVRAETLVVATGEWPPYVSPQLKHYGVTARIVREAFELAGYDVEFQFYPWARVILMSEQGLVDASFPWSHKPEREKHHLYSDAIGEYGYVFFHLKSTPFDWDSLDDLRGWVIGATRSYNYGAEFLAGAESGRYEVDWATSDKLNWRKLFAGRIDVFPNDLDAGFASLNDLFPPEDVERVAYHPVPLKTMTSMHLLFSKQHPQSADRLQRFNAGLRQLIEEGKLERYWQESRQGLYDLVSDEVRSREQAIVGRD
ncbi:MAG: transporter substrate-binding domain-containing protein [Marinobacter sp.]|uniref:substrate-binding periplasmic protein n=1 Tax=Marinobacter sp. TaxID=50741 RepID=UPI00299EC2D0|nr:transporter substrate-binding domain-containing protein [Marinobacter sp.]MDX1757524.1 transporter substrate-binding domain-containing protein [Marinobacter sp.]